MESREEEEEGWKAGKMVPQSGPESLSGAREDAECSQGEGRDGRDAGTQRRAWPRALTALPCPAPTLALPEASVSGPPALPEQSQPPSQCPGSRVPQLLLGFSVEPRWGLMGDWQAPLNRILIIQLQQEFFPLGSGPHRYLHLHLSIFPALRLRSQLLLPLLPAPSPHTHWGGLRPISWGPRGGPGVCPNNHRLLGRALLEELRPGLRMASPDLGAGQRGGAHPSAQYGLRACFPG